MKRGLIESSRLGAIRGGALLAGAVVLALVPTGDVGSAEPQARGAETPEGPAPVIQALELEAGEGFFRATYDDPVQAPDHPPIDQIPPMPMPNDTFEQRSSSGPGAGVAYDPATGATREWSASFESVTEGLVTGGGYAGADGLVGDGDVELPATFNNMSVISTASRALHPWRMSVKVVMRFGGSYFVCSGTMRDAETVLTAGHCVFDFGGAGWANEIWIYPGWDGVGSVVPNPPSIANPYGWARGTFFGSWTGWTQNGDFNYDVGLIGVTRAVGMLTGWFGWSYGGSCGFHTSQTYHNPSYPAEGCGQPGLHNGRDMYYWFGNFDSCPSFNRLQVDTSGGCFNAGWGGMSGSGAYRIVDDNRFVHAVASTSDRDTFTRYARQFEGWVNFSNDEFIPDVRGAAFDLQALDVNAAPATIPAGGSTTLLNHLATNPTDGAANGNWVFRVYLSSNDNISSADTLLSTQNYNWNFVPMSSVRVNMAQVTIPENTSPGNYFLGLIYDPATDGNDSNDDTDGWDAVPVQVTKPDLDITNVAAPSTAQPGDNIGVLNSVRNIGNATAGSFRVGIYFSDDSTCTTSDTLLSFRTVSSLAAGATSSATTNISIPIGSSLGTMYICAIADYLLQVAETSENNNTGFDPIQIVRPDLRISSLAAPASASPGDTITVANTVMNAGTGSAGSFRVGLYLSPDASCTIGDTFMASRVVSSLGPGASSAQNTPATIPASAAGGTQHVCAIADDQTAVVESNEGNNTASDPIDIVLTPTVNLKINGRDADYPDVLNVNNPVEVTIDMTAGTAPLDHYFALIFGGTTYWVTPGGLSLTPAPLATFTPMTLTDLSLLDINLPAGLWGFAWIMLDGGTLVDHDIILADVP